MRPSAVDSLSGDEGSEKPRKCPQMYALMRQKSRFVFGRLSLSRPQSRVSEVENIGQFVAAYFERTAFVLAQTACGDSDDMIAQNPRCKTVDLLANRIR